MSFNKTFCITFFSVHLSVVALVAACRTYPIFMFYYMVFQIHFLHVYKDIQAQMGNSGHIYGLYHCWKDFNFFVEVCNLINITDWLVLLFICQGFREMGFEDPLHIYLFRILICFAGYWLTLHKKWSFPLRISSANMPNTTGNWGFGHIYRRNP